MIFVRRLVALKFTYPRDDVGHGFENLVWEKLGAGFVLVGEVIRVD